MEYFNRLAAFEHLHELWVIANIVGMNKDDVVGECADLALITACRRAAPSMWMESLEVFRDNLESSMCNYEKVLISKSKGEITSEMRDKQLDEILVAIAEDAVMYINFVCRRQKEVDKVFQRRRRRFEEHGSTLLK